MNPNNYEDLVNLSAQIKIAMELEYHTKLILDTEKAKLEKVKGDLIAKVHEDDEYAKGLKVAQIAQKDNSLINASPQVKTALEAVLVAQEAHEATKRQRIYQQNVFSITKAFLYAQSGGIHHIELTE